MFNNIGFVFMISEFEGENLIVNFVRKIFIATGGFYVY